jgi:HemY protein
MMRLFLWVCVCLVVGGFLAYQIQQGSGYVLVVMGDTSIEMSVWFALMALFVLLVVAYILLVVIRGGFRGVHAAQQKIVGYSASKAQQQTVGGLIDFIEGDWAPAQKKLTRAAKNVSSPIINYLAAARCAYEMDKEQDALQLLHLAEKSADNSGLAVALTQARMQLSNQQYEQALATLARAEKINPKHNVVLTLQQQVYVALKDWTALKTLLPSLHQKKIGSVKQRYQLERTLYTEWFTEKVTKNKLLADNDKTAELAKSWSAIPEHFQKDETILSVYANELLMLKKHDDAEAILMKGLSQQWCDQWAEMYGLIVSSSPEKPLKNAEKWLKSESKNPVLLLTLGRLCLQNKQWGRAKDFFSQSITLRATADAYAELARLQHFLGADKDSQESSRQGLLHSVNTLVAVAELEHKAK